MITTLKNQHLAVEVESFGAQLMSIKYNNINYLWNGDEKHWSGRAPILFPIVGALRDGYAHSQNGDVNLPQHGLARISEFELESHSPQKAVYLLKSDVESRKKYPYDFEFRVTYTLEDKSIITSMNIKNTGNCNMPWFAGGHPGFNVPLEKDESFDDYQIVFKNSQTIDCPFVDKSLIDITAHNRLITSKDRFNLNHLLFRGDALIMENLDCTSVKLQSKISKKGVQMDFEDFEYFAVWSTVKDAPFVCLEPWTGTATLTTEDDIFENKRGLRTTLPQKEDTVSFTVTVF